MKANKGTVHRFIDGRNDGVNKYMLVVSANHRAGDKYVSVLMLGNKDFGSDVVDLQVADSTGGNTYVHCGMITYVLREKLGECVATVSPDVMHEVENTICSELDIYRDLQEKLTWYKELLSEHMNPKEDK